MKKSVVVVFIFVVLILSLTMVSAFSIGGWFKDLFGFGDKGAVGEDGKPLIEGAPIESGSREDSQEDSKSCNEDDGGANPLEAGTTILKKKIFGKSYDRTYNDKCKVLSDGSEIVIEYSCNDKGGVDREGLPCAEECVDNACVFSDIERDENVGYGLLGEDLELQEYVEECKMYVDSAVPDQDIYNTDSFNLEVSVSSSGDCSGKMAKVKSDWFMYGDYLEKDISAEDGDFLLGPITPDSPLYACGSISVETYDEETGIMDGNAYDIPLGEIDCFIERMLTGGDRFDLEYDYTIAKNDILAYASIAEYEDNQGDLQEVSLTRSALEENPNIQYLSTPGEIAADIQKIESELENGLKKINSLNREIDQATELLESVENELVPDSTGNKGGWVKVRFEESEFRGMLLSGNIPNGGSNKQFIKLPSDIGKRAIFAGKDFLKVDIDGESYFEAVMSAEDLEHFRSNNAQYHKQLQGEIGKAQQELIDFVNEKHHPRQFDYFETMKFARENYPEKANHVDFLNNEMASRSIFDRTMTQKIALLEDYNEGRFHNHLKGFLSKKKAKLSDLQDTVNDAKVKYQDLSSKSKVLTLPAIEKENAALKSFKWLGKLGLKAIAVVGAAFSASAIADEYNDENYVGVADEILRNLIVYELARGGVVATDEVKERINEWLASSEARSARLEVAADLESSGQITDALGRVQRSQEDILVEVEIHKLILESTQGFIDREVARSGQ